MTKDELINAVIKTCKDDGLTKRLAGDVVDAAFENISKAIKKEKRFAYPSFGTFTVRSRKARKDAFEFVARTHVGDMIGHLQPERL